MILHLKQILEKNLRALNLSFVLQFLHFLQGIWIQWMHLLKKTSYRNIIITNLKVWEDWKNFHWFNSRLTVVLRYLEMKYDAEVSEHIRVQCNLSLQKTHELHLEQYIWKSVIVWQHNTAESTVGSNLLWNNCY